MLERRVLRGISCRQLKMVGVSFLVLKSRQQIFSLYINDHAHCKSGIASWRIEMIIVVLGSSGLESVQEVLLPKRQSKEATLGTCIY
jgi:hypothetical protein